MTKFMYITNSYEEWDEVETMVMNNAARRFTWKNIDTHNSRGMIEADNFERVLEDCTDYIKECADLIQKYYRENDAEMLVTMKGCIENTLTLVNNMAKEQMNDGNVWDYEEE